jgi:hypothetical protein
VKYIERNKNIQANDLVKAAAHNTLMPADVFFQVIEDAYVDSFVEAQTDQYHRRGRLERSNNGISSSLL